MDDKTRSIRNRRIVYAVLAVVVFVVGVWSRMIEHNTVLLNKYLGDGLYAIIFYVCLAFVFPTQPIFARAAIIAVFVITVEGFQLTGIPLRLRQGNLIEKLLSIVLGTRFSWYDMLAYAVGIVSIVALDVRLIMRGNK